MKITELGITVSRTFNVGNYESLRVEASATASIENDEELDAARDLLIEEYRRGLVDSYEQFKPKRNQS